MGRRGLLALAVVPALVLTACGGGSTPAPSTTTNTPGSSQQIVTNPPAPTGGKQVAVRWFVGLGSGTQPNQIADQSAFVSNFNATNPDTYLQMEIVPNATAYDVLQTEIAAGHAPDIIGPVGVRGRNGFGGKFLDLTDQIKKNNVDLSVYPQATVQFFQEGANKAQIGLPYLLFPGFLWYNIDLFKAQQIAEPPTTVGAKYGDKDWTWDTLTEVAKKLTLDKNDKHPGDAGFDATKAQQWGIDFQWADGRRMASTWGAGSFVASDGKTAQIPDAWAAAWKWYYDAMWKDGFAPRDSFRSSPVLNNGTTMSSGKIGMDVTWGWAINSIADKKENSKVKQWNIAVIPSYKGTTTSPLDADTFCIWGQTKVADNAFKAMVAIMADKKLQQNYGGMPAKTAEQKPFLADWETKLKTIFPDNPTINWGVYDEMIKVPAIPSHEADMPNFLKVIDLYSAFYTKLQTKAGLNVDAELTKLKSDIQAQFDAANK